MFFFLWWFKSNKRSNLIAQVYFVFYFNHICKYPRDQKKSNVWAQSQGMGILLHLCWDNCSHVENGVYMGRGEILEPIVLSTTYEYYEEKARFLENNSKSLTC